MVKSTRLQLREAIAAKSMLVAPGCYDGLTARMIAAAGFPAVYMTGAGTASAAGLPDYGLLTMTEMVANAARIAAAVDVPVIADADTGFGNPLNVTRAVREYERAGVAAIHLEDQGFPKKCGHLDDKEIVPEAEFVEKIRAAVAARTDPDFVIIARTDARAVLGLDAAIARANAALVAGADMAFVEAPATRDELAAVTARVQGPCLYNLVFGGKSPDISLDEAEATGFAMTILPDILWREVVMRSEAVLGDLAAGQLPPQDQGIRVRELFDRVGAGEWDALRTGFADRQAAQ